MAELSERTIPKLQVSIESGKGMVAELAKRICVTFVFFT